MQKEIDQNGPYPRTLQGTYEIDAFVKLYQVVLKHGYMQYQPAKDALLLQRMELIHQKKGSEYARAIKKQRQDFGMYMITSATIASEFLDSTLELYQQSEQEAKMRPEIRQQLAELDEEIRMAVEEPMDVDLDRREIKQIVMEYHQAEGAMEKRVAEHFRTKSRQEAIVIGAVEKQRMWDQIYIDHNLRPIDLLAAIKKYGLDED